MIWKKGNTILPTPSTYSADIEDTDKVNNENVFTGQDSTLWHNIRDAF